MRRTLYGETHELFRESVRTFIEREVTPHFEKWERDGLVDKSLYRSAGDMGLLAMAAPAEYGGGDNGDFRFSAIIIEEFCSYDVLGPVQGLVLHTNIALPYLLELGTSEQKDRWLPGLCTGELVAAIAMTEPSTGSDLGAVSTRADRNGDEYVINGGKHFITNGINCDLVIVVCRTGPAEARHHNLSLVVVESGTPGFDRGRKLDKVGQHSADTAELFFTDARVPAGNLLGQEGRAFHHLVGMLPRERLSIAVTAIAHAESAFRQTLAYCKDRRAFGKPIGSFQHNRFALATMRTELDIATAFVDRQIEALAAGELTAEDAAAAKWWCTELNKRVLDGCLQLHGGYGYMEEYPIARAWRDGRAMSIYGGTTEIMKDLIGRRVLGI